MKIRFLIILFLSLFITLFLVRIKGNYFEQLFIIAYQNITGKKGQQILKDDSGIPVVFYEGATGKQYNIVAIAEYALNLTKKKDSISRENFFTITKWLMKNCVSFNDSSIIFLNYFHWDGYKMRSPWRSAMNQSRVMQVFLNAYKITNDSVFLDYARKSMNTLYTDVRDGGVTYIDSTGYWYEEYADDDAPQSLVLNGMIVVLQSLKDYYEVTKDPNSIYLFNAGVRSLRSKLPEYDNNGHSYYDILKKPAKPWYHAFHIELLKFLYDETGEPIFKDYYQKWAQYKEPSYLESIIKNPTRIGVFMICTILLSVSLIIIALSLFYVMIKNRLLR